MEKSGKKILVVSPTPTHPQNAGNRARIYKILKKLRENDYEIHFIYDDQELISRHVKEKPNMSEMIKEWDKFFYVSFFSLDFFSFYSKYFWRLNRVINYTLNFYDITIGRFGIFLKKYFPKIYKKIKLYFLDKESLAVRININKFKKNKEEGLFEIDKRYNFNLDNFVKKLHKKYVYDFVLVEYVFISRVLNNFDENVIKIIDTHDVFTERDKKIAEIGIKNTFFSLPIELETMGLNRADRIIGIQEEESEFFKGITQKPVFTIGHFFEYIEYKNFPKFIKYNNSILFVGTGNVENIDGITYFISNIFPLVRRKNSTCELIVVGNICNFIKDGLGIKKLGEIKRLNEVYKEAGIAINPSRTGSGLKIKNIEALGYLKPLVVSKHSSIGMDCKDDAFLIAENDEDFADKIVKVLSDEELYKKLMFGAGNFIEKYNKKNLDNLRKCFSVRKVDDFD